MYYNLVIIDLFVLNAKRNVNCVDHLGILINKLYLVYRYELQLNHHEIFSFVVRSHPNHSPSQLASMVAAKEAKIIVLIVLLRFIIYSFMIFIF